MMLTPGDIRNKMFDKARNGYRPEEVQIFLGEVASLMEAMLEERADTRKKLEILADKVEQYREEEDSLRAALIGAQKLGDSVVRDSKRKAEAIIAQATRKSEEMIADAQANLNREAMALNKMQVEVAKFKSQILALYKKHIELIQEIPYDEADLPSLENEEVQFVASIGETVEITPQVDEAAGEQGAENKIELTFEPEREPEDDGFYAESEEARESEAADAFPRKRSSRFGTLRFGEDYSLTRKD